MLNGRSEQETCVTLLRSGVQPFSTHAAVLGG